ncbi:hypothetical protein FHETE_9059 [Fusarium heterosporum]|uniref:Heterokaryon incompatibility domain-containing protein n=1 Tax=Fusarium heterosporum TaxID=42747 RepID=A0A8H5WIY2_FUSHE|nr:hypothetical protein FHETE_9059 [Fusarium heterosporum]
MNDTQQKSWKLPGGIQPHSCQSCRRFVIFPEGETKPRIESWRTFTLQQVCEFANSDCKMFHILLSNLCESKNNDSDFLDKNILAICKSAYHRQLQLFYPLRPRITKALKEHILELSWSADDSKSYLMLEWKRENSTFALKEDSMTLFALGGDFYYPPVVLVEILTYLRCMLYLKETNSYQPASYAALSYCWGDAGQNTFTTTNETLTMREQGFDVSQLPETLRHAVEVARALDIRHLWVDALCIIQDCPEDKNQEIAKMWQIYQNASVVISAATASHSDQGFLHERDLSSCYLDTWAIPWHEVDNENNTVSDTVFCALGEIRRIKEEPTDLRAWTLQETKLGNRVLRFGSSQMVWRCAQGFEVDGGSNEQDESDEYSSIDEVAMFYEWKDDVKEFTTRSISKAEDRLPAFAAIAANYAKRYNIDSSQYVAGLWLPWIAPGLLWYVQELNDKPTCPALPPGQSGSPTWSWHLARSGISWSNISYQGHINPFEIDIPDCHVELWDKNVEYGRVRKGSLKVVGALLKIFMFGNCPIHVIPNGSAISVPIQIKWDKDGVTYEKELYCLKVRKVGLFVPEGIVLETTGGNVFRRVGYFHPDNQGGRPLSHPIWLNRQSISIE